MAINIRIETFKRNLATGWRTVFWLAEERYKNSTYINSVDWTEDTVENTSLMKFISPESAQAFIIARDEVDMLGYVNGEYSLSETVMVYGNYNQNVYNSDITDIAVRGIHDEVMDCLCAGDLAAMGLTLQGALNLEMADINGIDTALDAKADISYVDSKVSTLLNGADAAHDTFKELQDLLTGDETVAAALATTVGNKVDKISGKGLSTVDFTTAKDTKLSGVATSATANSSDATLLARTNHTGTQAAGTITGLATVATSGAYNDLSGKPTIPSTVRTTSALTLSLVSTGATGTQIHATKDSKISTTVSTSATATIAGAATSTITLKICATNNVTEGSWTTVGVSETSQSYSLAVALQGVTGGKGQLITDVPAGWYVKLVNTGSGTHSETFVSGQQTIFG